MGLFSLISSLLTGVGYALLTYKTSFILSQSPDAKESLLEPLGMKWIVFLLFLMFESTLEAILDIIPFGSLALLAIKCMIVLPENTLATYIYKRIQKYLQKMEFEQYNSKLSLYTSKLCKVVTLKCINSAKLLAVYVKRAQLQDIYLELQNTLKTLEYKRMTVEVKHDMGKSTGTNLDQSVQNISDQQLAGTQPPVQQDIKSSDVINRMSMIYLSPKNVGSEYKVNADIMVVKPDKQKNIKPKYEKGQIIYNSEGKNIAINYTGGKRQQGVLSEIKYVKVNMMVIQLILKNQPSVVIKFLDQQDVFPWVKPVMASLNTQ